MFRSDVVVVEVPCLFNGVFDYLLGPRRLGQLAHCHHVGPRLDDLLDLQPDLSQVDVEVLEDVGGDSRAFLDQPKEDVLGADVSSDQFLLPGAACFPLIPFVPVASYLSSSGTSSCEGL